MSDLRKRPDHHEWAEAVRGADRSRFLSALDAALMRLTRAGYGQM